MEGSTLGRFFTAAHNFSLLLRWLQRFLRALLQALFTALPDPTTGLKPAAPSYFTSDYLTRIVPVRAPAPKPPRLRVVGIIAFGASYARKEGEPGRLRQPMSQKGHEDQFPPPTLSDRCRFGQATFAKTRGMGEMRRKQPFARLHADRLDPSFTAVAFRASPSIPALPRRARWRPET